MQTLQTIRKIEPVAGGLPGWRIPPFVQLAHARSHRTELPVAPRRPLSLANRKSLAAARQAELVFWLGSGGDYLHRADLPSR